MLPLRAAFRRVFAVSLFAVAASVGAASDDGKDIAVRIQKNGPSIVVDVDLPVAATALEAWNVMTDYDNMARFISNLQSSRIIGRDGNTLTVEQKGRASRGPLTLSFEN